MSGVSVLLRSLKLPGFVRAYAEVAEQAEREGWGFERYLLHLAEIEVEDRRCHRIERLLRQSSLPREKTLCTLELARFPVFRVPARDSRKPLPLCTGRRSRGR